MKCWSLYIETDSKIRRINELRASGAGERFSAPRISTYRYTRLGGQFLVEAQCHVEERRPERSTIIHRVGFR
jgi:hypothetical protein